MDSVPEIRREKVFVPQEMTVPELREQYNLSKTDPYRKRFDQIGSPITLSRIRIEKLLGRSGPACFCNSDSRESSYSARDRVAFP